MRLKLSAVACTLAFAGMGSAHADDSATIKALQQQLNALQQQIQALQGSVSKVETTQAKQQATAAAAPSGGSFLERKDGDGLTFLTRGGEVSIYGNLDLSIDDTTKGIRKAPNSGDASGNLGWQGGISSNLSYIGIKGKQSIGSGDANFVYQLETQIDVSATSGTSTSNSADSNSVKGGLTSRNSFIGVASPEWGAVKIGKTDAPYKTSTARMNPFSGMLGDYSVIMGNTGGDNRVEFGTRLEHAIWYESPNWGGFSFNALASPGQNRASDASDIPGGSPDCAGGNVPGSGGVVACTDGSYGGAYSANAAYTSGPLYATVAYELHQTVNRSSDIGYDANDVGNESAAKVGVQYKFPTKTTVSAIYEHMNRDLPAYLQYQDERTRSGTWLAVTQELTAKDALSFGWGHAGKSRGDLAAHNDGSTTSTLSGAAAPGNSSANMYTLALMHQVDKNLSFYADWAETINGSNAHYDLGAGGRGLTTDCHDGAGVNGNTGDGAPSPSSYTNYGHCYAGAHLQGVSVGMKYKF